MAYNPRFPTNVVVVLGTFNKKWLIQFQNRKKHDREFVSDILSYNTPSAFENLEEVFEYAEHHNLKIVDVRIHRSYLTHVDIEESMKEKIENMRKEFNGTYTAKLN